MTVTTIDDTPRSEPEAKLALGRAVTADPARRAFYGIRYDGGSWSVIRRDPDPEP